MEITSSQLFLYPKSVAPDSTHLSPLQEWRLPAKIPKENLKEGSGILARLRY